MLPTAFQHTYAIFVDFYQPKNIARIGDPEWGTNQFSHVSYFIIQPSISAAVTDEIINDIEGPPIVSDFTNFLYYFEIKHFKPFIRGETKALFLDDYHRNLVEEFLGDPKKHGAILSSKTIGESEKRLKFLNQYVQIYHGHWREWRIITDPKISIINFNKSFTKALVHFDFIYQGGQAYYEFKSSIGKWVLKESKLTWIQ